MRRAREVALLVLFLAAGCRSGGACRPEPVPTCDPKDGTCVDKEPGPPVTSPPTPVPTPAHEPTPIPAPASAGK